jgi:hypothetical protein
MSRAKVKPRSMRVDADFVSAYHIPRHPALLALEERDHLWALGEEEDAR